MKYTTILIFLLVMACNPAPDTEAIKQEIIETEKAFEERCSSMGLAEGFSYYAADDAVVKRAEDSLIVGKKAIHDFYDKPGFGKLKLSWAPDQVDVSSSGDLAWAYGKYTAQVTDSTGAVTEHGGFYMTVWRKQADGSWRFVWD